MAPIDGDGQHVRHRGCQTVVSNLRQATGAIITLASPASASGASSPASMFAAPPLLAFAVAGGPVASAVAGVARRLSAFAGVRAGAGAAGGGGWGLPPVACVSRRAWGRRGAGVRQPPPAGSLGAPVAPLAGSAVAGVARCPPKKFAKKLDKPLQGGCFPPQVRHRFSNKRGNAGRKKGLKTRSPIARREAEIWRIFATGWQGWQGWRAKVDA